MLGRSLLTCCKLAQAALHQALESGPSIKGHGKHEHVYTQTHCLSGTGWAVLLLSLLFYACTVQGWEVASRLKAKLALMLSLEHTVKALRAPLIFVAALKQCDGTCCMHHMGQLGMHGLYSLACMVAAKPCREASLSCTELWIKGPLETLITHLGTDAIQSFGPIRNVVHVKATVILTCSYLP